MTRTADVTLLCVHAYQILYQHYCSVRTLCDNVTYSGPGLAAQPSQLEGTLQSLRYLDKITDEVKARVDDIMGNKCALYRCLLCCYRSIT